MGGGLNPVAAEIHKRARYDSHSAESATINGIISVSLTRSILCLHHSPGKIKISAASPQSIEKNILESQEQ